jgi:hypothetical protein
MATVNSPLRNQIMSDPKVVKNPQANLNRNPRGPQGKLSGNPYNVQDLRFPKEVAINPKNKHWIRFTPTIQQAGQYKVATTNQMSVADTNRSSAFGFGGQIGSGSDPLSGGGAVAGLGVLAGAEAAVTGDAGIVGDIVKNFAKGTNLGKGVALGQAASVVAGGLITALAVSGIDMTRKTRRAASYISLYMPDTINVTVVNDYDQLSLTEALGKAGLAAQAGGEIIGGELKAVGGGAGPGATEAGGFLAEKTGNFGSGITDALLFSAGYAQNPQIELLFKSIQNREFLFDFKFVPKTQDEAVAIINIIKAFRFHAAPEIPKTGGGRYFIPPDEFDIQFMYGDSENRNLPKVSTCVLQGIDVNYASAGQWTTFANGMPVEIAMQLRFKEIEIMHKALITDGY